jgi:GNAT superfamily N-acetyltransferase
MMTENGMTIRAAGADDAPTLLRLIRELAAYEERTDTCTVTESALRSGLFGPRPYAEEAGEAVGFALYFSYFSPNIGVPAMFMELIYVVPGQRGQGTGRALLQQVARIAVEQGADRLEWGVLKKNAPAIGFYDRLGATIVDDFMACRLDGDSLRQVADWSPAG